MWKRTSYNTSKGVHALGETPFRGNYASIGQIYDEDNDIFRQKQPYTSWTLNTTTAQWEPPTPIPLTYTDDKPDNYTWNETTQSWDKVII